MLAIISPIIVYLTAVKIFIKFGSEIARTDPVEKVLTASL